MDPTCAQANVVTANADVRTLVTAGPGAGKTFTLVRRIAYLISDCGLLPGSEILVLSFSRAAVSEIRRRLVETYSDVVYVNVRTFDSFATLVLSAADPGGDWNMHSYDERICDFVNMHSSGALNYHLRHVRHVIVDEAQDLLSARARMVAALVGADGVGCTIFCDPAQGIYGFSRQGDADVLNREKPLHVWICDNLRGLRVRRLDENFRAESASVKVALTHARDVEMGAPCDRAVYDNMQGVVRNLETLGAVHEAAPLLSLLPAPVAVLCRSNGAALIVSCDLAKATVKHSIKRSATERVMGSWLGRIVRETGGHYIYRQDVERMCEAGEIGSSASIGDIWAALLSMGSVRRTSRNCVDLEILADRLSIGMMPDCIADGGMDSPLTVSTIHRAKGLEFGTVVVVAGAAPRVCDDWGEEARVLYVALTRAKKAMFSMECDGVRDLGMSSGPCRRWFRKGPRRWRPTAIEIRGSDFTAGNDVARRWFDWRTVGDYISERVCPGDAIGLRLLERGRGSCESVVYGAYHEETLVGITRPEFGQALAEVLGMNSQRSADWPALIDGARVDCIDTIAVSRDAAARIGRPQERIGLRLRPTGLASLNWNGVRHEIR